MSESAEYPLTLHANCFILGNKGVLLTGASASGKSALTLALVERASWCGKRGCLVSDDYTELFVKQGKLYGRVPKTLSGGIEIRGAGLYRMAFEPEVAINFVVSLSKEPKRYPEDDKITYCDIELPLYILPDLNTADSLTICQAIEALALKTPWKKGNFQFKSC